MSHEPPSVHATAFNCPRCQAYAHQQWSSVKVRPVGTETPTYYDGDVAVGPIQIVAGGETGIYRLSKVWVSVCNRCSEPSLWINARVVDPPAIPVAPANPDMPESVALDYREAAQVLAISPRAAAALIRLAMQKLGIELGYRQKTINAQIGAMVERGLDPMVQQAYDAIRGLGNQAVHPGEIDLSDDHETAASLFYLMNLIVDHMITRKKTVKGAYDKLPDAVRDAIRKRDE